LHALREKLGGRIQYLNRMTATEISAAASLLNDVVEHAREYVTESQHTLARIDGRGQDSVAKLLATQSLLLRNHSREMSGRAAAQDERAGHAAGAAKNIQDLAVSIERLAGEARLLAVNARIESSRLGAQSAGFEVLASEMQRLSDEVAGTNERVRELAERLARDLPAIAHHARELRTATDQFAQTAALQLDETERGVHELQSEVASISHAGGAVMGAILTASRAALSHLQFQDVVAQEMRLMDAKLRETHIEVARTLGADATALASIPAAEYVTLGMDAGEAPPIAPAGEVTLF
jgi:methyl-accepting chemotaxis protein